MPSFTPTVDGGQVETFITTDAGGAQTLHVQKLDGGGAAVGAEFDLTQSAPFLPVSVAALANGGYAVLSGYAFRGYDYQVSVFDAGGTQVKTLTLPGFGEGAAIAASKSGGFLVASRATVDGSGGVDYAGPPLITLYDNGGNALGASAQLTGDLPTILALADGHYQLTWTDGNLTHSLDYDPASPPDLSKPAAPGVQVIDDAGGQQGVVAAGGPTDDATPTLRVAVSHQGYLEVTFGQGVHDDAKVLGGVAVSADDVARGYVDIHETASATGFYDAYVHFKSVDGVASDATHVSFIEQAPETPVASQASGQLLTGGDGGATLQGGSGDDTVSAGSGPNYLRGGDGADSLAGGTGFNDINGNKGDDTIAGHSQVGDWLVGGQGDDLISTTTSGNILYGNLGNDTLQGGTGHDILRGGQGDDSIVAGSGPEWISGDRGADTIQGGSGPDTFHSFTGAGTDVVIGFDAAKGDHVQLDLGTHFTLSQSGADTVIDMGSGDELILRDVTLANLPSGWLFAA